MNQPATSASSRILDYLKTFAVGAEFTGQLVQDELAVSGGAVSGFFHKLVTQDAIVICGREGGKSVYRVKDLSKVVVRERASIGSKVGRTHEGVTSSQKVAGLLRQLADQVEGFNADITSYSTAELIRELGRRERLNSAKDA